MTFFGSKAPLILAIGLLTLHIVSCKPMQSSHPPTQKGQIHTKKDLKANTTQPCQVFGTYTWIHPGQEKDDSDTTPPANFQAAIRLEDGTRIYLQPTWDEAATRTPEELTQYHDKPVVVTGTLVQSSPAPPNSRAYIKGPCFVGPISIAQRSTWDALHGGKLEW
ncbi:MAG: hypothetical protein RLZZ519_2619 [Bacteroidota bacterium]|jgi:hypothetical protein